MPPISKAKRLKQEELWKRQLEIAEEYGLTEKQRRTILKPSVIDQLDRAKSNCARRLILGVSR